MALTSSEIAIIRLQSGDCDDGGSPIVSDAQIQLFYDDTESKCATVIGVVTARLANATNKSGVNNSTGSTVSNPQTQGILDQLEYWQGICPDAWPEMGKGTINLGIDEEVAAT